MTARCWRMGEGGGGDKQADGDQECGSGLEKTRKKIDLISPQPKKDDKKNDAGNNNETKPTTDGEKKPYAGDWDSIAKDASRRFTRSFPRPKHFIVATFEGEKSNVVLDMRAKSQRIRSEMGIYARFGSMARPKEGRIEDNGYGKIIPARSIASVNTQKVI
ncbi:hypothetical protein LINPERHAP2_LOCUS4155 [Linum perenne]